MGASAEIQSIVKSNMKFMIYQYAGYMLLTYIFLFLRAKEEVGGVLNSCLYSSRVQSIVKFVDKIWNGDVSGDNVSRTERRAVRKTVKLGKHESFAPGAASNKVSKGVDAAAFAKR